MPQLIILSTTQSFFMWEPQDLRNPLFPLLQDWLQLWERKAAECPDIKGGKTHGEGRGGAARGGGSPQSGAWAGDGERSIAGALESLHTFRFTQQMSNEDLHLPWGSPG